MTANLSSVARDELRLILAQWRRRARLTPAQEERLAEEFGVDQRSPLDDGIRLRLREHLKDLRRRDAITGEQHAELMAKLETFR